MTFEWQVPLIVIATIVALLVLTGRAKREKDVRPASPTSGPELIRRLQETLGIAIVVESIDPAMPDHTDYAVAIRATFIFGSHTRDVAVTGSTEAKAWEALADAAITWRNSDYQHIRIWGSGG